MSSDVLLQLLNKPAEVTTLAAIFSISPASVYQWRKDGRLPSEPEATYLKCLQHYSVFKPKMKEKEDLSSQRLRAEIENLSLKNKKLEYELIREAESLCDTVDLLELLMPLFVNLRTAIHSIGKNFPDSAKQVEKTLNTFAKEGEKLESQLKRLKPSLMEQVSKDD